MLQLLRTTRICLSTERLQILQPYSGALGFWKKNAVAVVKCWSWTLFQKIVGNGAVTNYYWQSLLFLTDSSTCEIAITKLRCNCCELTKALCRCERLGTYGRWLLAFVEKWRGANICARNCEAVSLLLFRGGVSDNWQFCFYRFISTSYKLAYLLGVCCWFWPTCRSWNYRMV